MTNYKQVDPCYTRFWKRNTFFRLSNIFLKICLSTFYSDLYVLSDIVRFYDCVFFNVLFPSEFYLVNRSFLDLDIFQLVSERGMAIFTEAKRDTILYLQERYNGKSLLKILAKRNAGTHPGSHQESKLTQRQKKPKTKYWDHLLKELFTEKLHLSSCINRLPRSMWPTIVGRSRWTLGISPGKSSYKLQKALYQLWKDQSKESVSLYD